MICTLYDAEVHFIVIFIHIFMPKDGILKTDVII